MEINNTYLHHIDNIPELIKEWDKLTDKGTKIPAIRALCLVDLYYLLVVVCKRQDLLHPWLYARTREVEADPDNHIDLWAREHGKSSIITFGLTIQNLLRDPELTIGIFSQNGSIAEKFLVQIKQELENNAILKAAFPDVLYDNPQQQSPLWSSQKGIVIKRQGNPKEASVESSGLVDSLPVGRHYKILVYDDVVVSQSVSTPEQIHKTTEAYELSLSLGSEGCAKRLIGTRYNFADTYSKIIKDGVVKPRIYAATDNGQQDGKPVLFGEKYWQDKLRELSPSTLACQYLQNPLAGTEKMFDAGDLERYEIRPHSINVYIMADPGRATTRGSDNTAIAVIAVDSQLNKYLVDGINHKCDLQDRWKWLELLYRKWTRQPGVQLVKVGYEKFGALADLDYFNEQMKLTPSSKFPIEELAWTAGGRGESSKTQRVQRLSPDFRQHKFFIPYPTNEKKLTKLQQNMMDQGLGYRIAKPIRRLDNDNNVYNVTEHFINQVNYFPVGLKDFIDAVSRIYDMDVHIPYQSNENDSILLEPMYT